MSTSPRSYSDATLARELEHNLLALVIRYGAVETPDLQGKTARCVAQIVDALAETSSDERSLSPLDVVRIRAGKFAATLTPPALYRDAKRLAAMRSDIHEMACAFVGSEGAAGSRFARGQPK